MQSTIVILLLAIVLLLFFVGALLRRKPSKPLGGNAANTDSELESLYSLLGDNSGRTKK